MKKKLLIALLTALCIVASTFGFTSVFASNEKYDGETNLATDSTLWSPSWFTNHYGFVTIDDNGILFDSYGTDTACGAVSLKEGLPYNGKVSITFNSEATNANGFFKVVFADPSGTANGNAMKPWDIAGVDHLALEIQTNSVAFWRYNKDGAGPFPTGAEGQGINYATNNYIDGEDHVLTIEYSACETVYDLKISIDDVVHYDGEIATSAFYCNNILTFGGYANSTVEDDLAIKSVIVEKTGADPAPVIDEDNLLGNAAAWEIEESAIAYDPTYATLTTSAYEGTAATLLEKVPAEAKISFNVEYSNLPAEFTQNAVMKIRVLDSDNGEVFVRFDDSGNVWISHDDKNGNLITQGDWVPGLLSASNEVVITITPELTDGDEGVYVEVSAAGKVIGLMVNDISLVATSRFEIFGCSIANATFSSVKVEDLLVEKSGTGVETVDLLANASNWSFVSSTVASDKIALGGQDYLDGQVAIPVNSTVEYTINGTSDANAWYYLGFGNFHSQLWDGLTFGEGEACFRIVTTGTQGFYLLDLNYTSVAKASSDTTLLFDGTDQHFKWVTETVEDGLKVTLYRNDVEEFSQVYGKDTAIGSSDAFYLMFRATGAHNVDPVITNVKYSFESAIDYTDYNAAVAIKRAIYGLEIPTEENAETVKATAEALINDLDNDLVDNVLYAEYIIDLADAQLAIVADKAAAQPVIDAIETLATTYATITAENVEQAEIAVVDAQDAYNALTDAQKTYVTNYGKIEDVQIAIDEYELSILPGEGESSSEGESMNESEIASEVESVEESKEEGKQSGGCSGSFGATAIASMLALVGAVMIARKKRD